MKNKIIISLILALLLMGQSALAGAVPAKPGKKDKCPVCGMFVYKYPDWVSAATGKEIGTLYFDGAKDLFKYLLMDPGKAEAAWVTEYYGLSMIKATEAHFVMGSDVYGPMGHELIPFASKADAKEFMADHKGKRILRYEDVDEDVVEGLK